MEWIDVNDRLPTLNEEYLVVWDVKDGEHPVVTSMDFDVKRGAFTDPRGTGEPLEISEVLFWGEYPDPPKIEKKRYALPVEQVVTSMDDLERLAYGQCVHGENVARCQTCNPHA